MDLNSTYKLPLIRWLPVIIDSETVHGLEWMDPLKTKFKYVVAFTGKKIK